MINLFRSRRKYSPYPQSAPPLLASALPLPLNRFGLPLLRSGLPRVAASLAQYRLALPLSSTPSGGLYTGKYASLSAFLPPLAPASSRSAQSRIKSEAKGGKPSASGSRWRDLNPRPLPYQGSALPLSYIGIFLWSGRRGSNSRPSAWKADALSTELLPHCFLWAKMDSNHRRYKPADLQSAPFGHSGIRPTEPLVGFEPTTRALQMRCSGQLS